MPSQQPNTLRSNEQPDVTISFPEVSGIQSEMPSEDIEAIGFEDVFNLLFRKSRVITRPPANLLTPLPASVEPFVGVADFWNPVGARFQVAMTPTKLWTYVGNAWVALTGSMTGSAVDLFTWTVVGGKLLFCQGVDKVKTWDGIAAGISDISANAVPAKFLFELDNRLIAAYTVEASQAAPQRFRWTAPGDATDWTTFAAGQQDLFNDLGPITGGLKLFQQGYIWQRNGINQLIPTGSGLNPFRRESLSAHSKGNICPASLAAFGETTACYVGKDNIYSFDGTVSTGIGDAPITGHGRMKGARTRIYEDLRQSILDQVVGFMSTNINGMDFNAYWLLMPPLNIIWIYNFTEDNWTRIKFPKTTTMLGNFKDFGVVTRISDLVGDIASQTWSPSSYRNNNPLDQMFVGYDDGNSGIVDFTGPMDQPWFLKSGQSYYNDKRHLKTLKRFVIKFEDIEPITLQMDFVNDQDETDMQVKTVGTGSGKTLRVTFEPSINGEWIQWKLSGNSQNIAIREIRPIYDIAGEIRG